MRSCTGTIRWLLWNLLMASRFTGEESEYNAPWWDTTDSHVEEDNRVWHFDWFDTSKELLCTLLEKFKHAKPLMSSLSCQPFFIFVWILLFWAHFVRRRRWKRKFYFVNIRLQKKANHRFCIPSFTRFLHSSGRKSVRILTFRVIFLLCFPYRHKTWRPNKYLIFHFSTVDDNAEKHMFSWTLFIDQNDISACRTACNYHIAY